MQDIKLFFDAFFRKHRNAPERFTAAMKWYAVGIVTLFVAGAGLNASGESPPVSEGAFIPVADGSGDGGPAVREGALRLELPTDNAALFENDGPRFFMFTDRNFEGRRSSPWEAGQFGFVRNQKRTSQGIIHTRFHAGIDIAPVHRNSRGEPQDEVRAIADGKVVYVTRGPNLSNYGNYIVIEHLWDGSPIYSLYAHLNSVAATAGQEVEQGDIIGLMGYTGTGIDRRRAHLHLELNMKLNSNFERWFRNVSTARTPNHHGKYNGQNLAALDVMRLFLALREKPDLTIREFLEGEDVFFKVAIPNTGRLDLLDRYPWLTDGNHPSGYEGWEISFTQYGLPLEVQPIRRAVSSPRVTWVNRTNLNYGDLTRGLLSGSGQNASLSPAGLRYIRLIGT